MKPIEPGCLAVVTYSAKGAAVGKELTPLHYIGQYPGYRGDDYWLVDRAFPYVDEFGERVEDGVKIWRESWMMRIDGHEIEETEQEAMSER